MTPHAQYLVSRQTLLVLVPEFLLLLTAMAMMTAGAFVRLRRSSWCAMAAGATVAAIIALIALRHEVPDLYAAAVLNDPLSGYGRLAFLLAGLILLGMAHDQVDDARAAEFFGAMLMIQAGADLVAASNELVLLFVGLELVSIPTYLLLYLPRRNEMTQEAATKYFYLSVFSSALLLFGLAYLYGLTGVSNLKALSYLFARLPEIPAPLAIVAAVFVLAGLGFRVAAVPFHFYAPDVYEGSPTVIAALLAWVPKGIGFVAIVRTLTATLGGAPGGLVSDRAVMLAWVIALATMTLGNTVALLQDNLKRLLAYSSIAHAGYLMVGVAVAFRDPAPGASPTYTGTAGVLFYLAAYALMTLGFFGVILATSTPERPVETVDDLAGLFQTNPWAAIAGALCLFSLAGVPPLAGFWGKFWIFSAALAAGGGADGRMFQVLAVLGVLNAAIGAYYYLRLIVVMFLRPSADPLRSVPRAGWPTQAAVGACAALSLLLGLFPAPLVIAARESAVAANARPEPIPTPAEVAGAAAPGAID